MNAQEDMVTSLDDNESWHSGVAHLHLLERHRIGDWIVEETKGYDAASRDVYQYSSTWQAPSYSFDLPPRRFLLFHMSQGK
jgi:hypothetical protein